MGSICLDRLLYREGVDGVAAVVVDRVERMVHLEDSSIFRVVNWRIILLTSFSCFRGASRSGLQTLEVEKKKNVHSHQF